MTRDLKGTAGEEVLLEARDGDINLAALNGVQLKAGGGIKLETRNVYLPEIEIYGSLDAIPTPPTILPETSKMKKKQRNRLRSKSRSKPIPTAAPFGKRQIR